MFSSSLSGLSLVRYDLMTMSIDEIERVYQPFAFRANRDATLHGFACWFTVDFESSAMRTDLPQAPDTSDEQANEQANAQASEQPAPDTADKDDNDDLPRTSKGFRPLAAGVLAIDGLEGDVGSPDEVVVLTTAPSATSANCFHAFHRKIAVF